MRARSPFAGSRVMHVGDEVCAGLLPTLLPLGSFLEAAQSSVLIKMRPLQRLSWALGGIRTPDLSGSICRGTLRRRSRRDPPLIHAAVVPELPGSLGRIDAGILPPGGFVPTRAERVWTCALRWGSKPTFALISAILSDAGT